MDTDMSCFATAKLTVGKGLCGGRCTTLLLPGTLALTNASVVGLHTYTIAHVWKFGMFRETVSRFRWTGVVGVRNLEKAA
jgi:hypothetical protein